MNAPPRLSTVNAPATSSGSPVATYASISSSVMSATKLTRASAVASARVRDPSSMRMTLWPECRIPVLPRIMRQRSAARSGVWGLP